LCLTGVSNADRCGKLGVTSAGEANMSVIPDGAEVVDQDGERLGNVIASAADYIVAEEGLFFPTDYYIPRSAITDVTGATVRLNVSKADALNQGWDVRPDAPEVPTPAPGNQAT